MKIVTIYSCKNKRVKREYEPLSINGMIVKPYQQRNKSINIFLKVWLDAFFPYFCTPKKTVASSTV